MARPAGGIPVLRNGRPDPGYDPRKINQGVWAVAPQTPFLCDKETGGCGMMHPIVEHRICRDGPEAEAG